MKTVYQVELSETEINYLLEGLSWITDQAVDNKDDAEVTRIKEMLSSYIS